MMEFTKAEISKDGRGVRLTLSDPDLHLQPEGYFVRWDGSGHLAVTSQFDLNAVAEATFPAGA
jgi:hypothetical protein